MRGGVVKLLRSSDGSAKVKIDWLDNFETAPPLGGMVDVSLQCDREGLGRLFLELAPRLKAYLRGLDATPEAAENLVQETLIMVWRNADQFDPSQATPAAWIFAIARKLNIEAMRRMDGRKAAPKVDAPADAFTSRERETDAAPIPLRMVRSRLRVAMARLRETVAIRRAGCEQRRQPDIVAASESISISRIEG